MDPKFPGKHSYLRYALAMQGTDNAVLVLCRAVKGKNNEVSGNATLDDAPIDVKIKQNSKGPSETKSFKSQAPTIRVGKEGRLAMVRRPDLVRNNLGRICAPSSTSVPDHKGGMKRFTRWR